MSHCIVLVKQVPDVTQVGDDAFDLKTGHLVRSRLPNVINPLDEQALGFAIRMRSLSETPGMIVALTMGPPAAEAVLRYALARGADAGVLMSDPALAGADTRATANPLACAIRRIARELFDGSTDYFIVSGMQSVDGDTGQVPVQIAEELACPCIAYAVDAVWDDIRIVFKRIVRGGSQRLFPIRLPAVITVAQDDYSPFPTVARARWANAVPVTRWTIDDIQPAAAGSTGSLTRVVRVFQPPKTTRKCRRIDDIDAFARELRRAAGQHAGETHDSTDTRTRYVLPAHRVDFLERPFEMTQKQAQAIAPVSNALRQEGIFSPADIDEAVRHKLEKTLGASVSPRALEKILSGLKRLEPRYSGEVWVVIEHENGHIHPAAFELLGQAHDLAEALETRAVALLAAGDATDCAATADRLIAGGADRVYVVRHTLLDTPDPRLYAHSTAEIIARHWPQICLFPATPWGRIIAPMAAYRLNCGLTADCTSLAIGDDTLNGEIGILLQTRTALGGNVMATIQTVQSRCQMATARPGVFTRLTPDPRRRGDVVRETISLSDADRSVDILSTERSGVSVDFDVDVIVSGGRGFQSRDAFSAIIRSLVESFEEWRDIRVAHGGSRAAVERGYVERARQVGQTGTSVTPNVYLALGISGAIQHMIGVANAGAIFAINNDVNAPIFQQCDYYMVGDVKTLAPALAKAIETRQSVETVPSDTES